jgi:hypothetical protein
MQKVNLSEFSDEELLRSRICDLGLDLSQTALMRGINQLYSELNLKLINFMPRIWLSDDWFSPDGHAGFAVPFYLAHPRLVKLEKKYVGITEGDSFQKFMQLLRHETAHALDNAYYLRKNKTRQKLFGPTSIRYPKSYLPDPRSKDFVRHLPEFYAQAHPDEDWAETFAVWLNPISQWEVKYAGWPALNKLYFVDEQMQKLRHCDQMNYRCEMISHIANDTRTLKQYYAQKRKDLKLNRFQSVFSKNNKDIVPELLVHKQFIKTVLQEHYTDHPWVVTKFLKDLTLECKKLKIPLKSKNKIITENQLRKAVLSLSFDYIKEGRHRIVM